MNGIPAFAELTPRLATSGQPTKEHLHSLAEAGFESVVNLGLANAPYTLAGEAGIVEGLGMAYHHIPVDFGSPEKSEFVQFCSILDACGDKKVLVHCAANKRAGCFAALYMQSRHGWSGKEVTAFVKKVWSPDVVWADFLEELGEEIAEQ